MFAALFKKIFGSRNDRVVRRLQSSVARINSLEANCQRLQDQDFPSETNKLRQRVEQGESLDSLLPEAFALVREASIRSLGMRHFDVQLIGGMVLHQNAIAEMKTGEGKTLVATLAAFLHALAGKGVHVVTVNDYLARRDAEWMGKLYHFLGMRTGVIISGMDSKQRQEAYQADITYGTNNEFGFDYLRDNMVFDRAARVMRELNYAIVDEVDCVLIDEARTPLIISGAVDDSTDLYIQVNAIVKKLLPKAGEDDAEGDFWADEKSRQVHLSERGHERLEGLLQKANLCAAEQSLYDPTNLHLLQHVQAALRAHNIYKCDVDYLIKDGRIVIVDEFTGRTMEGRRWGEGLHQAIEAKEGVPIQQENQTLASITYQNYFRMYKHLAGMTGTADTEAREFQQIYGLEVLVVPTHKNMVRKDDSDVVFVYAKEKFNAILEDIKSCRQRQQPVLVGTASIEVSEYLSERLRLAHIPHKVLNAKFHEKEAEIIAQAGRPGAVTIATNMAGRGTDIMLGGNYQMEMQSHDGELPEKENKAIQQQWEVLHEQVVASGGLRIIGTERHESRRIDNQLRGRSGRQGDPGSSCFYVSMEDNLLRIFASEWVSGMLQKIGVEEGVSIESKLLSRSIQNAQSKVEAHHFDIRKHLLQFDDVANEQRKVIYSWRDSLLEEQDISASVAEIQKEVVENTIMEYTNREVNDYGAPDIKGLTQVVTHDLGLQLNLQSWYEQREPFIEAELVKYVHQEFVQYMSQREAQFGVPLMHAVQRHLLLDILDRSWKDHLAAMDHLRQGIHLRSMAAKNPVQEYKREAFMLFMDMMGHVKREFVTMLAKIRVRSEEDVTPLKHKEPLLRVQYAKPQNVSAIGDTAGSDATSPMIQKGHKIGRNAPCPCGSGRKYKHCCGRLSNTVKKANP